MSLKKGDLVRWFDTYADGITKDSGLGLLVEKACHKIWMGKTEVTYTNWTVWRGSPYNDSIVLSDHYVQKIDWSVE